MKIVLDPGHVKGYNRGAIAGYYEGTAMFDYAYLLGDKLREQGFDVLITRKNVNENPTLMNRGKMAKGADMFVSLHSNGVDDSRAYGVSTFYSIKRDNDMVHAVKWCNRLANLINGGTRARGASTRKGGGDWDYYTVIQGAVSVNCPHVFLIEHGFHSNPDECKWLMQEKNLIAMANLECELICEILGVKHYGANETADSGKVAYPTGKIVNTPGDTLNVRKESKFESGKIAELEDKSAVSVTGVASNGWVHIKQGNISGWVNGSFLTDLDCSTDIRVTNTPKDTLNLRVSPVYTSQKIAEIPDKTRIFVWKTESNGWCLVCYNSTMGWVNGKYLNKV